MQVEKGTEESFRAPSWVEEQLGGSSLSALRKSGPVRISCPSLYWPRCFPLSLRATCWRPGVRQEDCGLHLAALQAPDWLPSWLLSQGLPLCESPAAAQRAGPVTFDPQTLLLSPGLGDGPVTMTMAQRKGEWNKQHFLGTYCLPAPGAVCIYAL